MNPNEYVWHRQVNHESCKSDIQIKMDAPEDSYNAGPDMLKNTYDDNCLQNVAKNADIDDIPQNVEENPNMEDTPQNVEENSNMDDTPQDVEENSIMDDTPQNVEENRNNENIAKVVAENSVSERTEKYLTKNISSDNTEQQVVNKLSSDNTEKTLSENTINDISAQNVTEIFSSDNSTKNVIEKLIHQKKKQDIVPRENKQTQIDNIATFNDRNHQLGDSAGDSTMQHQLGNSCESTNKKVKIEHCDRVIYQQHEVQGIGKVQYQVNQNSFQSSFDYPTDTIGLNVNNLSGTDTEQGKMHSRVIPYTPENSHIYENNQYIIHSIRLNQALIAGAHDLSFFIGRYRRQLSLLHERILAEVYVPHDEIRRLQRLQYFRNRSTFLYSRTRRLGEIIQLVIRELRNQENGPCGFARKVRLLSLITEERNRQNEAMETEEND